MARISLKSMHKQPALLNLFLTYHTKNLDASTKIGIDPTLISASDAETIKKALSEKKSSLVPVKDNLVDAVWAHDQPVRTANPIFHLDEKYAGSSAQDKIQKLREELKKGKYEAFVVTMLDDVAWLFNLRGSDIDYNPGQSLITD
jgi:Xaa-Pro aminopeptidase